MEDGPATYIRALLPGTKRKWIGAAAVLLLVAIVVLAIRAGLPVRRYIEFFLEWTRGLGYWGPVAVALFYVLSSMLFLPGAPLTMGAGLLFGLLWGTVVIEVGATLGACGAFLIARFVGRGRVAECIKGRESFEAIDDAVGREGFKIVFLIRLSPILPYNLQNFAFGLTSISFWSYAAATAMGMIPGVVLYVYIGTTARSLARIAAGEAQQPLMQQIFFWGGLVVTAAAVAYVTRVARQTVRREVKRSGANGH